jgi:HD-like signal output (HDOD) protein
MPGMDGIELLQHVLQRSPSTVRIVLSGQCDRQGVLKTVGLAHQFLAKPCDPQTLQAAVLRACRLREGLRDARHAGLVSRVGSLPSPQAAYSALLAELELPDPSVQRLGRIVARDVAMAAKLLQLVSSAFFGAPQRSADPGRWTAFLGAETIRLLAQWAGVLRPAGPDLPWGGSLDALNAHSRKVAASAMAIAAYQTNDAGIIAEAYLAGLLHDVGLLVLAESTGHADVGGYLLALWGAPDAIVDAALLHHCPSLSSDAGFTPLAAVHVADAAAEAPASDVRWDARLVDMEYLRAIRCAARLDQWYDLCRAARCDEVPS